MLRWIWDWLRVWKRRPGPFDAIVTSRPDGGVDIAIDHPRGSLRWELPAERAAQLRGSDSASASEVSVALAVTVDTRASP